MTPCQQLDALQQEGNDGEVSPDGTRYFKTYAAYMEWLAKRNRP